MVIHCVIEVSSEHYYSCELTDRIPVRVSIMTINGNTGFGIVESMEGGEPSIQQYVDELRISGSTLTVEVTHKTPQAYWTRVVHRVSGPSIYDTVLESGCMTFLPIVIEQGAQTHSVLAPSRKVLRDMLYMLRERFSDVRIKRLRSSPTGLSRAILSSKQGAAFKLAFASGYYDIPRLCKVEDLAAKLGIKRVAMQERLRRAEQRILRSYAEQRV
jgi:predicted DNA binding protein